MAAREQRQIVLSAKGSAPSDEMSKARREGWRVDSIEFEYPDDGPHLIARMSRSENDAPRIPPELLRVIVSALED